MLPALMALTPNLGMFSKGDKLMNSLRTTTARIVPAALLILTSCTVQRVDFSGLARPQRAVELDAFNTFVGSWTWEAVMLNAADSDKAWTGTAEWKWTLDNRCLEGKISGQNAHTNFDSQGIWSWHPKSKKYFWWMFNNWGYPHQGKATYNSSTKTWNMHYTSIGLDGTTSFGRHRMTVVDNDTLEWDMVEWADPMHLITKMEMHGSYKRRP